MRIEIEGLYPGLGATSLIRTVAWTLVDLERKVLVLSEDGNLDRKFCEKPSGAADEYLLDLARGKRDASASDYAKELHPRLRILESSSVLSRNERVGMREEVAAEPESVLLTGRFSGKPAKRFLVVPADPAWLKRDKKRLSELPIEHLFVSHLSQENCCQDMCEAYGGLLRKPFTLLPTCAPLQREWLEPLELRSILGSPYGQAVRSAVERLLCLDQVREKSAVYKVMHRFRRSRDGR